jgi:hypothetical protein
MKRHMIDDLHQRLRAARPQAADVDEHAFDAELLDRVRAQPTARVVHDPDQAAAAQQRLMPPKP